MDTKPDIAATYRLKKESNSRSTKANLVVHSVSVKQVDRVYQEAKAHQFTVRSDEHPEPWGGGDRAPSPFQYLLLSLGFSLNNQVFIQSEVHGVRLDSLETVVEGSFDAKGFYGVPGHTPRVDMVSLEVKVTSHASRVKVLRVLAEAEKCCPVYQTLKKSARITTRLVLSTPGAEDREGGVA